MSQFTDRLQAGIKHLYQLQDGANKMFNHSAVCIHEACDVHKGLHWTRKGREITLWAHVTGVKVLARWGGPARKKVLTASPNEARPGFVRIVAHYAGPKGTDGEAGDVIADCDELFASQIEKLICQSICNFLSRNTLVTS